MKCKILWSGITDNTGKMMQRVIGKRDDVVLAGGICRSSSGFFSYEKIDDIKPIFDVLVDFSHPEHFDKLLQLALKYKKPFVVGTSGLSDEQMHALEDAAKIIPVFKGGNFRFLVKTFIDEIVSLAKNSLDEEIILEETHYKSMHLPSQTALVIKKRVEEETGKKLIIKSTTQDIFFTNQWCVQNVSFSCPIYDENLVNNILSIAFIMCSKKADGIYDLDRLYALNVIDR